jgi:hypothetical protein
VIRRDDEVHASVGRFLGHRDQSPAGTQHSGGATQPLAADGVEHDVDGPHGVLEARCRIDDLMSAEIEDRFPTRRRGGPDHVRAGRAGQLHREPADATGGTVDQDTLAGAEPWPNSPCQAMSAGSGIAALSACDSARGLGTRSSAGTAV